MDVHELVGKQTVIGIVEDGASLEHARRGIDRIVERRELAGRQSVQVGLVKGDGRKFGIRLLRLDGPCGITFSGSEKMTEIG